MFYMPPWHIDSEIFRPTESVSELACEISFAATMNSYAAERSKWREGWDQDMHLIADSVIKKARETKDYVDAFDLVTNELNNH